LSGCDNRSALAKEIVARLSGMSFAEFARRRLFEPLGMKSSAYVPDILQAGLRNADLFRGARMEPSAQARNGTRNYAEIHG
jgi:CubicO group peptidase (beta-lactamase class C family)